MNLFELRGKLPQRARWILQLAGILLILLLWYAITAGESPLVRPALLPSPAAVLNVYPELITENDLFSNLAKSISLNLAGYIEAIVIAIPIGFVIGLIPLFQGLFQRPIDAFRYVPLTAVTGLFIVWFGLQTWMKVHFLAFGILIYLLPVVVQRIMEVKDVYIKMVYTLGANKWQTVRSVYIPSVLSRLSDDIRVLTAISWTYIIVAESLGNEGGVGGLIWRSGLRLGRVDKVFAILLLIILVGIVQDKWLASLDKALFPYKYNQDDREKIDNLWTVVWNYVNQVFFYIVILAYLLFAFNEIFGFLGHDQWMRDFFGGSVWSIHVLFMIIILYKVKQLYSRWSSLKV